MSASPDTRPGIELNAARNLAGAVASTVATAPPAGRRRWRALDWFLRVTLPGPIAGYRADVDGLRAVAVLSVLLFHFSGSPLPGGYIGVDIFFVISGYLISGILFREHATGRFSFTEFYARRLRRLGPALIVVLVACLMIGWVFLLGDEYKSLGRHTAVSSIFGSNILSYFEIDYFAVGAYEKPLLHLWSLGIEEQFYVFWPLLLWLLWRHRSRLVALLVAGLVISFAACVIVTGRDASAAFYLPHTRYWEFLVGALLAYRETRRSPRAVPDSGAPAGAWRTLLASGGMTLIGVALWKMDGQTPFPGVWAALPVTGTAAVIAAGPRTFVNRALLGNSAMVGIGGLAYPLYLWHWPLFVFVFLAGGNLKLRLTAFAGTFMLAWLTKVLVEDPVRFGAWARHSRRITTWGLLAGLLLIGGVGLAVDRSNGIVSRYPAALQPLASYATMPTTQPVAGPDCFLRPKDGPDSFPPACVRPESLSGGVLVWGDSFADHLVAGVRNIAATTPFPTAEYAASACPPLLGVDIDGRPQCRAINDFVLAQARARHPSTVVLAANWLLQPTSVSVKVTETIQALKAASVARVVVTGPLAAWPSTLPALLARKAMWEGNASVPRRLGTDTIAGTVDYDRFMARSLRASGAEYVSLVDMLCDDHRTCLTLVPGTAMSPMQFDTGHLSREGSLWIVGEMARRISLP